MSFFCPEIAVLHSAFALVERQFGKGKLDQIPKDKCTEHVNTICTAIEEIVDGLEEDNTEEEQILWKMKIHDILLFKVCQSHDVNELIVDENTFFDKTDMVAQIFPTFGSTLYIEVLKKCGWSKIFFDRLDNLSVDISRTILKDIVDIASLLKTQDESDILLLFEILDYTILKFFSIPSEENILSSNTEEACDSQESFLISVLTNIFKALSTCDLQKFFENVSKGNVLSKFNHMFLMQDCVAQFLLIGLCAVNSNDLNIDQLKKWFYLNTRGYEMNKNEKDGILPCLIFPKSNELGKYNKNGQMTSTLDLNVDLVKTLQINFPWSLWSDIVSHLFQKPCPLLDNISEVHLSRCVFHLESKSNKIPESLTEILLKCSFQNLVVLFHQVFSGKEDLLGSDVLEKLNFSQSEKKDYALEALVWRISNKQPGYIDCIEELLKNKFPHTWTDKRLISALQNNLDLLADDMTLMRTYDLVIELEDQLLEAEVSNVKKLVTSAFVKLPSDTRDRHIYNLYTKYRHWPSPGSLTSKEITAAFNKLTNSGPTSKVNDIYKQLLQNPELVLQNIMERAITSKNQVTIYTEILKTVPSICKASHHDNNDLTLLVFTLNSYLQNHHLGHKEQQNVVKFLEETLETGPNSLLDPVQFLTSSVLPYLNMENMYSNSYPITARFSFELFLEVVECLPRRKHLNDENKREYLLELFKCVDFPAVFLCVCELAHECIDVYEADEILLSEKLKIKQLLYNFWFWLDYCEFIHEEVLQPHAGWLLKEMTRFDFTIQLLILIYVAPMECVTMSKNLAKELVERKDPEINAVLPIIRMFSTSSSLLFDEVYTLFDDLDIQYDYHSTVLALVQVLPNLDEGEWEHCLSFVEGNSNEGKLQVPDKFTETETDELLLSMILSEVTTLLQYTKVGTSKLALNHYLKCYIQYMNDHVINDDEEQVNTLDQRAVILSESFGHVVNGVWWMDEADSEPCSVLLLDIVRSLEDIDISTKYKHTLCKKIEESVHLIKSEDTSIVISKKLKEMLKSLEKLLNKMCK